MNTIKAPLLALTCIIVVLQNLLSIQQIEAFTMIPNISSKQQIIMYNHERRRGQVTSSSSSSRSSKSFTSISAAKDEHDFEALVLAAQDPKSFEAYVLNKNKKEKEKIKTQAQIQAVTNEEGGKKKGYVPIEQWNENRSKDNLSWEEKVQFEGQRLGNQFRQNEILRKNLKSW